MESKYDPWAIFHSTDMGDNLEEVAETEDCKVLRAKDPKTITRQFYSDYITPLEDGICADGTTIHIIYAKQMGEKYCERYHKHFKNPDICEFDMKHEAWLNDDKWRQPVLECIYRCMEA